MTPKEKAQELYSVYGKIISKPIKGGGYRFSFEQAKQCALIAVDELITEEDYREGSLGYWRDVKQEIELL